MEILQEFRAILELSLTSKAHRPSQPYQVRFLMPPNSEFIYPGYWYFVQQVFSLIMVDYPMHVHLSILLLPSWNGWVDCLCDARFCPSLHGMNRVSELLGTRA